MTTDRVITDPSLARGPHHDGSPLYVSNANPQLGDTVRVRVRVPEGYGPIRRVFVRSNPDHEPHWDLATRDGLADGWEWWTADVVVANPRHGYRFHLQHADGRVEILNQGGLSEIDALDSQDFALVAGNPPPAWLADSVMYQVFPDRFARSSAADERELPDWAIPATWDEPVDAPTSGRGAQFYGGDLDGIIEKLDHLVALGITVLYHTPIFPAGTNHRYDASSFDVVDPLLGGDDAYRRLIEAAHDRGIRIIGDLTSNHSGIRHEWFQAAYGNPGAPEAEFYYFRDEANTDYEAWLGVPSLPKLDWNSPELRRRFIDGPDSVVAKWMQPPYGIDGWRIDVANMTGRLGAEDLNAEVRQAIRRTMIEVNPDTLLLAESTNDAATDLQGDAWHGGMTYPAFTRGVWAWLSDATPIPYPRQDGTIGHEPWFFGMPTGTPRFTARQFVEQLQRFTSQIPWRVQLGTMSALDTHDTARFAMYASPGSVPVAVGLSMTLPGLPVVYAGDEFGLGGAYGELGRLPLPWNDIDEPDIAERITLYRELVGLRHAHPALATGGLRWLHTGDAGVVFVRESAEETLLVLATRGDLHAIVPAGAITDARDATSRYGSAALTVAADGTTALSAHGPTFAVWALPGVRTPEPQRAASTA